MLLVSNDTLTITLLVGRQEGHPASDVKYRVSVLLGDSFFCAMVLALWFDHLVMVLIIGLMSCHKVVES